MKYYQLNYLISPALTEEEAKDVQEKITSFIQNAGGILDGSYSDFPKKRRLAYPIKKQDAAYIISLNFRSKPDFLEKLQRELKEKIQIIHSLLVIKKIIKEIPRMRRFPPISSKIQTDRIKSDKVEIKEIDQKLEEILG